jgi:hypothetical protein
MKGWRPDGWSRIRNFHIRCTRVWTMADWSSDCWISIAILDLRRSTSGRESTSSGRLYQYSHKWTWKESEALSNTERRSDGLLRRPDGCKLEQKLLDTVRGSDRSPRHSDGWWLVCLGFWTVWHIVRTDGRVDRWASGRDDTSSGRLTGNQNLLTCKQCRIF